MSLSAHPSRVVVLYSLVAAALALSAVETRAEFPPLGESSAVTPVEHAAPAGLGSILAVPEPGILVSLVGGVGVLLGLQRFRHRG